MAFLGLKNTTVTIGGRVITGWAPVAEALQIPDRTYGTEVQGPTGEVTYSTTGAIGGPVKLTLLPTSDDAHYFMDEFQAQIAAPRILWQGSVRYNDTRESVSFIDGYLKMAPAGHSLGNADPKNVEITFFFKDIQYSGEAATV